MGLKMRGHAGGAMAECAKTGGRNGTIVSPCKGLGHRGAMENYASEKGYFLQKLYSAT
jgi:hypothetical protein